MLSKLRNKMDAALNLRNGNDGRMPAAHSGGAGDLIHLQIGNTSLQRGEPLDVSQRMRLRAKLIGQLKDDSHLAYS